MPELTRWFNLNIWVSRNSECITESAFSGLCDTLQRPALPSSSSRGTPQSWCCHPHPYRTLWWSRQYRPIHPTALVLCHSLEFYRSLKYVLLQKNPLTKSDPELTSIHVRFYELRIPDSPNFSGGPGIFWIRPRVLVPCPSQEPTKSLTWKRRY